MRHNLLLVVLDCLRLDYWRHSMPLTRQITRNWHQLRNHWAVAHCSDPNHAALFTGFGPWQTGITTQMGSKYKEQLPTLAWRWRSEVQGTTWAVMPLLVPEFYRANVELMAWHKGIDSADLECKAVRQFAGESKAPWFGFIRDMTCHYPYLDMEMPPRGSANDIRPQYELAVAHVDTFLSSLLTFILHYHPNTIIVITSDHGELLGEHDQYDHLYTLYNILTRVPMAIRIPGVPGKRTNRPTQHTDLMPTLCNLLGWRQQGEGFSLAPWMTGEATHPTPTNRTLWLQGTGAGPNSEEHLQRKGGMALDPGLGRVLWRHRGIVKGAHKWVEDWFVGGQPEARLTGSGDYKESKALDAKRIGGALSSAAPPFPDYHEWERAIVSEYWRGQAERKDQIVMQRLKALGYA